MDGVYASAGTLPYVPGLREIQCPGMVAAVVFGAECAAGGEHVDGEARLAVTLHGSVQDRGAGYVVERTAHSVMFRPAGTAHRLEAAPGSTVLRVSLPAARVAAIDRVSDVFSRPAYAGAEELGPLARQLQRDLEQDDAELPLRVESMVLAIVARLAAILRHERERGRPAWLDTATAHLRQMHRIPIRRHDTARELGVSPEELGAAFRRFEGRSFEAALQEMRLESARELLTSTCLSIADIAQSSGFYDHSHLVRAFRRHHGMTPGEYRRGRSQRREKP